MEERGSDEMYHSITFGDFQNNVFVGKNTWNDWYLIPSSRPVVSQAGVSTSFMESPGRKDGPVDFSEFLTGHITFGQRTGSFEFIVDNDHEYWITIMMDIVSYLHGKRMKMILEDDPDYYYEGRFSVNDWKSESWNSKVVINYVVSPKKYPIH